MSAPDRLAQEIARATARIGQVRARQVLREMRRAAIAKAKAQKADQRRRFLLGGAVVAAGLADWDPAEITGLLLDAAPRIAGSPTMRLAMRKKADGAQPLPPTSLH